MLLCGGRFFFGSHAVGNALCDPGSERLTNHIIVRKVAVFTIEQLASFQPDGSERNSGIGYNHTVSILCHRMSFETATGTGSKIHVRKVRSVMVKLKRQNVFGTERKISLHAGERQVPKWR